MANPYESQSASNYNASPPPDDGSESAANLITWAGIKTKLADPIKAYIDAVNSAVSDAFGQIWLNSTNAQTATYDLQTSDQGKTVDCSNSITVNLLAAATAGDGFACTILNSGSGTITLDPSGAETINGGSTYTLTSQYESAAIFCDGSEWFVVGTSERKVGYKLTAVQTFTASGDYTKTTGVRAIKIIAVGAGGGGGGCSAASSTGGGGGGAGEVRERFVTSGIGATETVTIGAAGTGGANTGGDGGAGGDTSFGAHVTAKGGSPGTGATTSAAKSGGLGGTGGTGGTGFAGAPGGISFRDNASSGVGGIGGSSRYGGGGLAVTGGVNGNAGTGYGAGGSGAAGNGSVARAGGAGSAGLVIVEEYL